MRPVGVLVERIVGLRAEARRVVLHRQRARVGRAGLEVVIEAARGTSVAIMRLSVWPSLVSHWSRPYAGFGRP